MNKCDLYNQALSKWPGTALNLSDCGIGDKGAQKLSKWGGTYLNLSYNNIGDKGARSLGRWRGRSLELYRNNIGNVGVQALSRWRGTTLDLRGNNIGDKGVQYFHNSIIKNLKLDDKYSDIISCSRVNWDNYILDISNKLSDYLIIDVVGIVVDYI